MDCTTEKEADRLLAGARAGDSVAMDQLWSLMRMEFRKVARALLRRERDRARFGTTGSGLVAELWLKLATATDRSTRRKVCLRAGAQR